MFKPGETVIYGGEGVCTVEKIDSMDVRGVSKDKLYYFLTPLYRGGTIYAPLDTPVRMREVISAEEAEELIKRIPDIPAEVFKERNVRLLSEKYLNIIKSYNCEDLVRVIKTIYNKRENALVNGKKLGSVDERFLNRAEDMLHGELAVALGIEKEEVNEYIKSKLS